MCSSGVSVLPIEVDVLFYRLWMLPIGEKAKFGNKTISEDNNH